MTDGRTRSPTFAHSSESKMLLFADGWDCPARRMPSLRRKRADHWISTVTVPVQLLASLVDPTSWALNTTV